MTPNPWPWSLEEEAEWERQLQQQEFGWMEEWIDHAIADALAGSCYDPLEPHESDEELVVE